jgi:ferredoxin, 2Fe-2S
VAGSFSGVVSFIPIGRKDDAKTDETLLDVARRAAVPIGNPCGGIGVCARCRVTIVSGAENLSGRTSIEARIGLQRGLGDTERFACQAVVRGDCTITTPYW